MKRLVVAVLALVVIGITAAVAAAQSTTRVTGGGQFLVGPLDAAEDTLTFEVQGSDADDDGTFGVVQGEVELVTTDSQDGQTIRTTRFHGRVTCFELEGNTATFAGYKTRASGDTQETGYFEISVTDVEPQGDDVIKLNRNDDDGACDNDAQEETSLFRGEAQITQNGGRP